MTGPEGPAFSTLKRVLAVVATLGLMASCTPDEQSGAVRELGYLEVLRLGSLDGLEALPEMPMDLLAMDSGEIIVLTASQGPESPPFVFDPEGAFSRRIGGSGQGPGEFTAAMVGTALPGDSLMIHDLRQSRSTVFTPEGEVGRIIQFGGQVTELIPLAWPDTVLAVMWPQGRPGQWYQLVDLGGAEAENLREFGSPFPTDFQAMVRMRRFASAGDEGQVWTVDNLTYELHRWTAAGDSVSVLRPESDWFATPNQGFGPDSVPATHIVDVQHLGGDTVAVGLSVARQGWQNAWSGVDLSSNEVRPPDASELYEGVIEFRRAGDGSLIGSQRLPGIIFAILPDSRIATYRSEGPGYPVVQVFER
ncbi:MAG: hypothetical protein KJO44_09170 [Gemmatimonadetes bacterium]|nr:hypothetical protein [Gemmatimonadota bacterium]